MMIPQRIKMKKLRGYSLLEIILVTSFVLIFLIVINPALYVERFSKMLVKMNVLNESNILINKLNALSFSQCEPQLLMPYRFDFNHSSTPFSLLLNTDGVSIENQTINASAYLYRFIDLAESSGFNYFNYFAQESSVLDDVVYVNLNLASSLTNYNMSLFFDCHLHQIHLGEF